MQNLLLVGTRKGLFILEEQNGTYVIACTAFIGVPVVMVLHDPRDNTLYAALGHGHFGVKLHRSDDNGKSWTEITAPTFPPKPDDAPTVNCPMRGTEIP